MRKNKAKPAPEQEQEKATAVELLMKIMAQQEKTDPALLAKQRHLLELLAKDGSDGAERLLEALMKKGSDDPHG